MYSVHLNRITTAASVNGERITALNAHLFGRAPHVAPEAWLHALFAGLSNQAILDLERKLGRNIPVAYADFLRFHNGISIFSGSLTLFGGRFVNDRSGDAAWQPFDIVVANTSELPPGSFGVHFYIGSYFDDGSRLAMDSDTGSVMRVPQRTVGPILTQWPSFEKMFSEEIVRLELLFDSEGRPFDQDGSTLPNTI